MLNIQNEYILKTIRSYIHKSTYNKINDYKKGKSCVGISWNQNGQLNMKHIYRPECWLYKKWNNNGEISYFVYDTPALSINYIKYDYFSKLEVYRNNELVRINWEYGKKKSVNKLKKIDRVYVNHNEQIYYYEDGEIYEKYYIDGILVCEYIKDQIYYNI